MRNFLIALACVGLVSVGVISQSQAYNPSSLLLPSFTVRVSPIPITSASPTVISSPAPLAATYVSLINGNANALYLEDFQGCGATVTSKIFIPASAAGILLPFKVTAGDCVDLQAVSTTSSSEVDITFFDNY